MNDEKYISFLKELASYIKPTSATVMPVLQAQGRYLAEDVIYYEQKDEAHYAETDGFAVAWSIVASATPETSVILPIFHPNSTGSNQALFAYRIRKNECLPPKTDTVITTELLVNYTENDSYRETIEVAFKPSKKFLNTRTLNTDNTYRINKSQKLTPEVVALLLAYGVKEVKVFERPVVGLIWGAPSEESKENSESKDININHRYPVYWLGLLLQKNGVPVIDLGNVSCSRENIDELLDRFSWQVDCLVWCGDTISDPNISNRLLKYPDFDFSPYINLNTYNYSSTLAFEIPSKVINVNALYNLVLTPILRYMSGGALKMNYLEFAAPGFFNLPASTSFCLLDKNYQPVPQQIEEFDILNPQNKSEYVLVVWDRLKQHNSQDSEETADETLMYSQIDDVDTNTGTIIPIGNIKSKTKSVTILEALELQEESNNTYIFDLITKKNEDQAAAALVAEMHSQASVQTAEELSASLNLGMEAAESDKPRYHNQDRKPYGQGAKPRQERSGPGDRSQQPHQSRQSRFDRPRSPEEGSHTKPPFAKPDRFAGKRQSPPVGQQHPRPAQERQERSGQPPFNNAYVHGSLPKKRFVPRNKPDQPSFDSPSED